MVVLHADNVIRVIGPLDSGSQPLLVRLIEQLAATEYAIVRLDLRSCTSMNSLTIGALLHAKDTFAGLGRVFTVSGCSDELLSIFRQLHVSHLVEGAHPNDERN